MKKTIVLLLSGVLLVSCKLIEPAPPPVETSASGISFFANCDLPDQSLESRVVGDDTLYGFSLKHNDKGGCDTDLQADRYAPYRERAELRQVGHLDLREPQVVRFDARFRHGFSGKKESFFQIQNSNLTCDAEPALMVMWHRGELELSLLQESGMLKSRRYPDWNVEAYRSWSSWEIRVARKSKSVLVVEVLSDGALVGRRHVSYLADCATPYVKFGVFRPGNNRNENETSVVEFRKFSLEPLVPVVKAARAATESRSAGVSGPVRRPK